MAVIIAYFDERGPISTGNRRSIVDPDRFRTTDVRFSALNA
jgi:hypothetical protein